VRICDRCKKPVDILIPIELTVGWNSAKHIWKYKNLEICKDCHTYLKIMRDDAFVETELKICNEFLQDVRESVFEAMR
jgi:hypothetical protein